jgi:hypothetical protein
MTYPLTKNQADSLTSNKSSIYNVSIYKYQNLLTGEVSQFEIIFKFSNGSVNITHNKNYTLKEKREIE